MLATILLSIGIFAAMMAALALGYILSGRCISGSCGGPEVTRGDGEIVCRACGRAKDTPEPAPEETEGQPESAS
jgi:hypothetical protein